MHTILAGQSASCVALFTLPLSSIALVIRRYAQHSARATRPDLAKAVRTLVLPNSCADDTVRILPELWDLDITLPPNSAQVDALVAAVRNLGTLCSLAVRKASGSRTRLTISGADEAYNNALSVDAALARPCAPRRRRCPRTRASGLIVPMRAMTNSSSSPLPLCCSVALASSLDCNSDGASHPPHIDDRRLSSLALLIRDASPHCSRPLSPTSSGP
ncbi:hypothetical protein C8R47DRAFT_1230159 [Mycena vitilis]|nr:hypothetical protein C8R47DRAFT_1230159 [Mycena vitilis]